MAEPEAAPTRNGAHLSRQGRSTGRWLSVRGQPGLAALLAGLAAAAVASGVVYHPVAQSLDGERLRALTSELASVELVLTDDQTSAQAADEGSPPLAPEDQQAQVLADLRQRQVRKESRLVILNGDGAAVFYANRQDLEGRPLTERVASDGCRPFADLLARARDGTDAVLHYRWRSETDDGGEQARMACARYFAPWDWTLVIEADASDIAATARRRAWQAGGYAALAGILAAMMATAALAAFRWRGARPLQAQSRPRHDDRPDGERGKRQATPGSEGRYAEIVNATMDGIFVHDAETGVVIDVNEGMLQMYRCRREDVIGQTVKRYCAGVAPYTIRDAAEKIRQTIEEGPQVFEWQARRGTRELFWVEVATRYTQIGEQMCVVATTRDISERKRAQEELHEAEMLLAAAFEGSPSGIVIADGPDVRIRLANPTAQAICGGCPESEDQGLLQHAESLQFFQLDGSTMPIQKLPLCRAIQAGQRVQYERFIIRNSGGVDHYVEANAAPVSRGPGCPASGIMIFHDVTERCTAQTRLRESQENLTLAMQSASMGTWEWDIRKNRVRWSPETLEIFGTTEEQFDGTYEAYLSFVPEESRPQVDQGVRQFLGGDRESTIILYDHETARPDGTHGWVEIRGSLLLDEKGRPTRMIGVCSDISARKDAEREREALEAQLRQSQKMEAVGKLAGGVAHDFNNLLQAILGYGEITRMKLDDPNQVAEGIDEILKAAHQAKVLVAQLLAFSRQQVLQMEDLDLNATIHDMVRMLGRIIGEHVQLKVIVGQDVGTVRADPGQIGQILTNLCVNARDAMSTGGTITIETDHAYIGDDYLVTHPWAKSGHYAVLTVTDTGVGMDGDTLAHAFDPFFTTKGIGQGTGLGLATVYGLVKQHCGHIEVYSEPAKGSVFKVYLPAVATKPAAVELTDREPVPGGTETILLAEDSREVRGVSASILRHAGYRVLPATDGEDALHVLSDHGDEIDLAILDVVMPGLGGRDVYERMRHVRPEIAVLFCSGYSVNAVHTNFILDEGLTLIQKPYQAAELLRTVRTILDTVHARS